MLNKRFITTLFALTLVAASWIVGAEIASAQNRDQLVEKYTPLAGSETNARTLVHGLRDGADFTLNGVKFDPPTKKMGYGEVNIALSLAEKQLGTAKPTAQQLQTALIGDAAKPGILAMRADGKGWGQIAQSYGIKLGDVMRAEKAERHARADRPERHGKPERPEKPARPEKPERPERPGR